MPRIRQNADRYRQEDFIKAMKHAQVDAGFDTTAELADAAGIPRATLWRRWKDPGDLTLRELGMLFRVLPAPVGALMAFLGVKIQETT